MGSYTVCFQNSVFAVFRSDSQRFFCSIQQVIAERLNSTCQSCDDNDSDDASDAGVDVLFIRYVMSKEMSTACATYAQWLDDSTQVSAKDLVIYPALLSDSLSFYVCIAGHLTLIESRLRVCIL